MFLGSWATREEAARAHDLTCVALLRPESDLNFPGLYKMEQEYMHRAVALDKTLIKGSERLRVCFQPTPHDPTRPMLH